MEDSFSMLEAVSRTTKPRKEGVSCLIDGGLPFAFFKDSITSFHEYIDFVKFGWTTGLLTPHIDDKIAVLKDHSIDFWFGGTMGELAYSRNEFDRCTRWAKKKGAQYFEVSDGILLLSRTAKTEIIQSLLHEFEVLTEVGRKDDIELEDRRWVDEIATDKEAGAKWVITEGRESGTSGLFDPSGAVNAALVDEILSSGVSVQEIIFEAPLKSQQVWLINQLGPHINLGNIKFADALGLETLRRGLRADTAFLVTNLTQGGE